MYTLETTKLAESKGLSKWKTIPCSRNTRIYIVKMALFFKTTDKVNAIRMKIQIAFCSFSNGEADPKIHRNSASGGG